MPTLQNAQGRDFVPNFAQALKDSITAFKEAEKARLEKEKLEEIRLQGEILADPDFSPKDKEEALTRITLEDPNLGKSLREVQASGNEIQMKKAEAQAIKSAKRGFFISEGKDFEDKQERLMTVISDMIANGEDTEEIEKLIGADEDSFNAEIDRQVTMGRSLEKIFEKEEFKAVPGRPDLQRSTKTGKLSQVPGSITPSEAFKAGQQTKTLKQGGEITEMQFNPRTQRFDIPIATTREAPDIIKFNEGSDEVTKQFDKEANAWVEISRAPREIAKAQTDAGKVQADVDNGFLTAAQGEKLTANLVDVPPELQSKIGKLVRDKSLAIQTWGENDPRTVAIQDLIDAEKDPKADIKMSDKASFRKEYTAVAGDFIKTTHAIEKIRNTNPNGPGDMSLIFAYMKLLDPGSTVREGEFANVENTGSIPELVWQAYNKAKRGDKLTPTQRAKFRAQAERTYQAEVKTQDSLRAAFETTARNIGLDPKEVMVDFRASEVPKLPLGVGKTKGDPTGELAYYWKTLPNGNHIFIDSDGTRIEWKPE